MARFRPSVTDPEPTVETPEEREVVGMSTTTYPTLTETPAEYLTGAETPAETPAENSTPEVLNGVTSETTRKAGRPRLGDLPEVDLDALGDAEDVPEDEYGEVILDTRDRADRSPAQMKIDAAVNAVHEAWIKADKPNIRTAPRKRYVVKPEFEATTRAMLVRAGAVNKVRVIQKATHDGNGMAVIVFSAIDRVAKKNTETPAETPNGDGTSTVNTPAE